MQDTIDLLVIMFMLLATGLPYSWRLSKRGHGKFAWAIFFASVLPIGTVFLLVCGSLYFDYTY